MALNRERANQWRRDEIARIDDHLERHWAGTVVDAALDGDPVAYGLEHLRHAAHTPINPDRLIAAAERFPLGRLTEAGPAEWTVVLDQATEVHRQVARSQDRDLGLSP